MFASAFLFLCVHVGGTENNLDEYIRMRVADIVSDLEASINGVYSNKYGVVITESMLGNFFSQIHQR